MFSLSKTTDTNRHFYIKANGLTRVDTFRGAKKCKTLIINTL